MEEQAVNEELLSEYGEQKNAPEAADPAAQNDAAEIYVSSTGNDERIPAQKISPSPHWLRRSMPRLTVQRSMS